MSTKEWVIYDEGEAGLFQEVTFDQENNNPATIEIANPIDFIIESESNADGKVMSLLKVDIPAERFDELATAWLKHRRLRPYKYTLDELLEKCDDAQLQALVEGRLDQDEVEVSIDELDISAGNDVETPHKSRDVAELKGMFKSDAHASIEDMRLEFDNIFDAITSDKNEAAKMKIVSDMVITMRLVLEKYQG